MFPWLSFKSLNEIALRYLINREGESKQLHLINEGGGGGQNKQRRGGISKNPLISVMNEKRDINV